MKDYLLRSFENSSNNYLTWIITSIVFVVVISVFISQYIPFIPSFIRERSFLGLGLNKFGFTVSTVSLFYLFKTGFTYFYYYGVRSQKKWPRFYFVATRFYFVLTILLILACIQIYYFPFKNLDPVQTYSVIFAVIFVFKIVFYLFHNYRILPKNWYYKFLYICTLQIIPLLVLLKFLFD